MLHVRFLKSVVFWAFWVATPSLTAAETAEAPFDWKAACKRVEIRDSRITIFCEDIQPSFALLMILAPHSMAPANTLLDRAVQDSNATVVSRETLQVKGKSHDVIVVDMSHGRGVMTVDPAYTRESSALIQYTENNKIVDQKQGRKVLSALLSEGVPQVLLEKAQSIREFRFIGRPIDIADKCRSYSDTNIQCDHGQISWVVAPSKKDAVDYNKAAREKLKKHDVDVADTTATGHNVYPCKLEEVETTCTETLVDWGSPGPSTTLHVIHASAHVRERWVALTCSYFADKAKHFEDSFCAELLTAPPVVLKGKR
ncbi:MAG: hypothetical protein ACE366_18140 [Bradymonadia bacterium]